MILRSFRALVNRAYDRRQRDLETTVQADRSAPPDRHIVMTGPAPQLPGMGKGPDYLRTVDPDRVTALWAFHSDLSILTL